MDPCQLGSPTTSLIPVAQTAVSRQKYVRRANRARKVACASLDPTQLDAAQEAYE